LYKIKDKHVGYFVLSDAFESHLVCYLGGAVKAFAAVLKALKRRGKHKEANKINASNATDSFIPSDDPRGVRSL
jgi:hypothetical protein